MQPIKLQQLSAFRHWGNDPIQLVKLNITMGKGDLGDFAELGVVVVARLAGLYIFAELLGFSHIGICRLYRECSKKRGNILFAAVLNALAIPEIRELYELLDGISNSNKHSLKPSYAEEHV